MVFAPVIGVLMSGTAFAKKNNYKVTETFDDGFAIVKKGKKFGVINGESKLVIPIKYNEIKRENEYRNSYAYTDNYFVKKGDKWGIINKNNEVIIPFEYDYAYPFNEGLAAVRKADKYGFIDKTGKVIVPLEYDDAGWLQDGKAYVEKGNKSGYVDKNGVFTAD